MSAVVEFSGGVPGLALVAGNLLRTSDGQHFANVHGEAGED